MTGLKCTLHCIWTQKNWLDQIRWNMPPSFPSPKHKSSFHRFQNANFVPVSLLSRYLLIYGNIGSNKTGHLLLVLSNQHCGIGQIQCICQPCLVLYDKTITNNDIRVSGTSVSSKSRIWYDTLCESVLFCIAFTFFRYTRLEFQQVLIEMY